MIKTAFCNYNFDSTIIIIIHRFQILCWLPVSHPASLRVFFIVSDVKKIFPDQIFPIRLLLAVMIRFQKFLKWPAGVHSIYNSS